uniref:Nuclear factor of activated T-cells, cytoplasmic 1 n=1 Tax=Sus scrofa TaxID=9823 RepID=A0A480T7N0_PIG
MTGLEEDQEFDFDFLFEFNQSDEGAAAAGATAERYSYATTGISSALPLPTAPPTLPAPCHDQQASAAGISAVGSAGHPAGYAGAVDGGPSGYFLPSGGVRPNGAPALESPRIEITSYLGLHHNNGQFFHDVAVEDVLPNPRRSPSTATLSLPNLEAYRDPSCLSPASSLSSRSCNSEASSYESSFSYPYASPQTSPWQSPCVSPKTTDPEEGFPRGLGACSLLGSPRHSPSTSPRTSVTEESWLGARTSRPSSPCNKRKYGLNGRQLSCSPHASPTPSPHSSPRVSVTDDTWLGNTTQYTSSAIVAAINALSTDSSLDLGDGVPVKARKTALDHSPSLALKVEPAAEDLGATPPTSDFPPEEFPPFQHIRKGAFCDQYLSVPQHPYPWARPRSPTPYASPSLPALDWQLPSHSGPYELRIEVQPKSHHRAHYETEGSRGAVKASAGGHPSVQLHGYVESEPLTLQLFIGTADDRLLRPHAFYQVHRITGKTVSTTSHEAVLSNTKVLEIPLLPENNMRAIIDCAGILKLRNSDIELRKGETDIGRKNTRVRLVFRVHIPQPNGRTLSLQVASNPIECSQRSAQELPQVEAYSPSACSVRGGEELVLTGSNFLPDSKVVFIERGPDGKLQWEEEATVNRLQSNEVTLTLTVPEYSNKRVSRPVQVYFYVSNGRRKRSPTQSFKFLPVIFKEEPLPDASLRGFPSASGPPFGSEMDFSPPRPPYPTSYPHEDPAYETPYVSEGFSYGTPPLYPQTGPPPSYRHGLRMFPETGGTTGCARPPPGSFLPRPFPSDPYGGRGSPFPLGLPFPPPAPFRPPLPSSPPLEGPFPPQSGVHAPPAEGYNEVGPSYGPGEGAPEQEKSRGGYGSGFRDSVPIQGITLEEVSEIIGRDLSGFPAPPGEEPPA